MTNEELEVTLKMLDINYYRIREKKNLTCLYLPYIEPNTIDHLKIILYQNNFNYERINFQDEYNLYIYLKGE